MIPKFSGRALARAYRDPLAWVNLAVDLLPLWAVFQFGWGATPLVALYWLENLVIGAVTVARLVGAGFVQLAQTGLLPLLGTLFLAAFFAVHYGGFCWGHGIFLSVFADPGLGFLGPLKLINWALGTAPHMAWFLGAIIAVNVALYAVDFVGRGEIARVKPDEEMIAPYGRIVTLHVAIILGAVLAFNSPEPLLGVFLLILIRVVFGVVMSVRRRLARDRQQADAAAAVPPLGETA